jgi:LPXTG-site transpeptidase (sortase) family protein
LSAHVIRLFALLLALLAWLAPTAALAAGDELPPVIQAEHPARLLVPKIGVDAPVVELGIADDGTMESPQGPTPVAWYTFSPTPGNPGNAVFAGHRDWYTGVTGVFWRLNELSPGDELVVQLADGTDITYVVGLSALIGPDEIPVDQIVGQTRDEMITLITCEGVFDPSSHQYDKRRVIRAGRAF